MSGGIRAISIPAFVFVEPIVGFDVRAITLLVPDDTLTQADLWTIGSDDGFNTGQFDITTGTFTVPSQGFYHTTATIAFDSNSTGTRSAQIDLNGVPIYTVTLPAVDGENTFLNLSGGTDFLRPGDVLTLKVRQDSGGVLAVTTQTTWSLFLQSKNV